MPVCKKYKTTFIKRITILIRINNNMINISKNLKKLAWYNFAMHLIQVSIILIVAKLMGLIFTYATAKNVNIVIRYSTITIVVLITYTLFTYFLGILYDQKKMLFLHQYKMSVYHQFLANPLNILFISQNGEVIEKIQDDFEKVTSKIIDLNPQVWINIITIIGYSIYICLLCPIIMVTLLTISLFQIVPPIIVKKYMTVNYKQTRVIEAKIINYIIEGYKNFNIIKLYGLKDYYLNGMKKLHKQYLKIGNRAEATLTAEVSLNKIVENILKYGTYAILGIFVLLKYCSVDIGVQAIALSASLFAAVKSLFKSIPKFAIAKIAENRLSMWFNNSDIHKESISNLKITLSNVNYAIENKVIFDKLSTCIDGNKISLIKGENGAGKSTLIRLILGLVQNKKGSIEVGGIAPNKIAEREYLNKLFYLPQEDISLPITANELVEMVIDKKAMIAISHMQDFSLTQKAIHTTSLQNLSGGERKKVMLSLALSSDTSLLILDEPTNSLDADSKQVLKMKLKKRVGGAIIVTHDDSFENIANHVLRINEGDISYD